VTKISAENGRDVLTTGQAAKLCHCCPRQLTKWFDAGLLRGYRLPGSTDRRIFRADLDHFMRRHGMAGKPSVLLAGLSADEEPAVGALLADDFEAIGARSALRAAALLAASPPDCLLCCVAGLGRSATLELGLVVEKYRPGAKKVALLTEDDSDCEPWEASGWIAVPWPVDAERAAGAAREALGKDGAA
jgi:hypothetical protein